jgi:4-amino-4-deoxy-L-arabinose transferase-like glycosyltransferase
MKRYFLLGFVILLGLSLKIALLLADVFPFNADEAIVGLMARHILMGEKPIFFYGQAYMGSLDAFLVAGVFKIFGQGVWGIRLVQIILYLFTILTSYWVGYLFFDSYRAGLIAAFLMAVPPVNTTLYTTVSLGGYGEALLIGNLILINTRMLQEKNKKNAAWLWFTWGFLCGFGLWANGLTLVYSIPAGAWLCFYILQGRKWRSEIAIILQLVGGLLVGSLPWWIFAIKNGWSNLITELFGAAVAVESEPFFLRSLNHLFYFIMLGLPAAMGLRPPWDVSWLGLPLIPFVLILWGKILWNWFKLPQSSSLKWILEGVFLTLFIGFVFTSFGVDPSGRYFLPLWVILSLAAGKVFDEWGKKKNSSLALIGVISLFNLWGNIQCALINPPGLTTQFYAPARVDMRAMPEVIQFLKEQGEVRGYSNYWLAYPLAFLTNEEIIFSPRFPYHPDLRYTERDDRYPLYTKQVEASDKVALITTRNPALDEKLRWLLKDKGIRWNEKQIGDFLIYYDLSHPLRIVEFEKLFVQAGNQN